MKRMYQMVSVLAAVLVLASSVNIFAVSAVELKKNVSETQPIEAPVSETQPAEVPASETLPVDEFVPEAQPVEVPVPETVDLEEMVRDEKSEVAIIPSLEDLPDAPDGYDSVPLYFQTDYPDHMYGSGTIANNGCSVTALAMVATYLTDHEYLPDELAGYFGGVAENNIDRLEKGAEAMQLPWEKMENFHKTMEALREGKVIIALMESLSPFTDTQHFIVLTGINEDGLIMVNDPYEPNYEKWDLKRAFRDGFTEGDICCGFSGAWAFDKSAMPEEPFLYYEEDLRGEPRYPDIHLTYEDRQLLARVIWVEAQGECEEGQQAVAEVVLNRMASPEYGNTLKSVIYAEGQFRSVPYLEDAEPYQAQYEAIERAIYGPYVLPEDVVHFATFPTNDNIWGQIGGHIFCYDS